MTQRGLELSAVGGEAAGSEETTGRRAGGECFLWAGGGSDCGGHTLESRA